MIESIVQFLDNVKETQLANDVLDVFGKHAKTFEQFDEVSKIFFKIKNYDKAIQYGESAYCIASTPEQMYIIRHNLVNVYNHNNYPLKALRYIKANEAVMEKDHDRDFEKAFSLFLLNRKQEAAELLRSKLNDDTLSNEQRVSLEFNLGTYDLIDGNLQQGLKRFLLKGEEMGIWDSTKDTTKPLENYGLTKWDGTIKDSMNLVIIAEAGIGDEIINIRFTKQLQKLGINYVWLGLSSRKDLIQIYKLNNINAVSDIKEIPKEFLETAFYIPSMQLPIALNSEYKDLWFENYLTNIDETYNTKWQEKLISQNKKIKIGIRWQGSPAYDQDLHRSIPLKEIMNAIKIDANLFSIQRDTGLEELEEFKIYNPIGFMDTKIKDLSSNLETLHDLFACINNLDFVITSCTSVAHIAAAMGKEVCVIVPISCYYVWCQPGEVTPWYGENVHVFYQKTPRSWKEPLEQLTNYINNL